jgi:hypothetical protein
MEHQTDQLVLFLIGASIVLIFGAVLYGILLLSITMHYHQKGWSVKESFSKAISDLK